MKKKKRWHTETDTVIPVTWRKIYLTLIVRFSCYSMIFKEQPYLAEWNFWRQLYKFLWMCKVISRKTLSTPTVSFFFTASFTYCVSVFLGYLHSPQISLIRDIQLKVIVFFLPSQMTNPHSLCLKLCVISCKMA